MAASSLAAARSYVKGLLPRSLAIQRLRDAPGPTVLLTFDDGPHPDVTPAVLDRLARHNARALFFVIGRRVKRAPHLLERIRSEGHVVGNHTYLHRARYVLPSLPRPTFRSYYGDCLRCQSVITATTGARPAYFRPPGGRLTLTTVLVPKLIGLRSVLWSRHVDDWKFRQVSEAHIGAAQLLSQIVAQDIVLLHDNNPCVLDLLDNLLPDLRQRGFDLSAGLELL